MPALGSPVVVGINFPVADKVLEWWAADPPCSPFEGPLMRRCPVGLAGLLFLLLSFTATAQEKAKWIDLFDSPKLEAWKNPSSDWAYVGDVVLDEKEPRKLASKSGTGVFYNGPKGRAKDLITKED